MAKSIKRESAKMTALIAFTLILTLFPATLWAGDDCEIVFPNIPCANPDSIASLVPGSFVRVSLQMPAGHTVMQPGYMLNDDGEMLTRRSTYMSAANKAITGLNGDTLAVISVLAEDALADFIVLHIDEPDQDIKPLKPRFYFPDNGEILALVHDPHDAVNNISTINVLSHGADPLYGYVSRLDDTPHDSLAGRMAVNHRGRMMGIIRSYKTDSLYANYLIPLSTVHQDGDHRSSDYFITKFSSELTDQVQEAMISAASSFWAGEYEQARDDFMDIILGHEANPVTLLYSAYSDFKTGDLTTAIAKAEEAIELGNVVGELYLLKGHCYYYLRKPDEALIAIDSALELNPMLVHGHRLKLEFYAERGEYKKAEKELERILDKDPDNPINIAFEAMMEMYDSNYEKACRKINRALQTTLGEPYVYLTISTYYFNRGMLDSITLTFRRALEFNPDEGMLNYYLATAHFSEDETDSALFHFEQAVEKSPYLVLAHYNLGQMYYDKQLYQEAAEQFEQALELYPDNLVLLRNLGVCYAELERFSDAIYTLEKATRVAPNYYIAFFNLGIVYMEMGELEKAEDSFDSSYALGNRRRNLIFNQGKLYLELGDTLLAKEKYEFLRLISMSSANKLYNLIYGLKAYEIDSSLDLRIEEYIESIRKSLVGFKVKKWSYDFGHIGYQALLMKSLLADNWGCVINDKGCILVQKDILHSDFEHIGYHPIDEIKPGKYNSEMDKNELDKSMSNAFADEFTIFSVTDKNSNIEPTPLAKDYPLKGDSVIVYLSPASESPEYYIARVLAVNPDPLLEKIIVLEMPFEISSQQGLILNMKGELAGFLTSIKIPRQKINFAIPAACLNRYFSPEAFDEGQFARELESKEEYGEDFNVGQVYVWLGNYKEAYRHLKRVGKGQYMYDSDIAIYLGYLEWKMGDDKAAEEYFKMAVKRNDYYSEAHYSYGKFLKELGRIEEAGKAFQKAVRHNRNHAMARYELGRIYIRMGESQKADEQHQELQKLDPVLADRLLGVE